MQYLCGEERELAVLDEFAQVAEAGLLGVWDVLRVFQVWGSLGSRFFTW